MNMLFISILVQLIEDLQDYHSKEKHVNQIVTSSVSARADKTEREAVPSSQVGDQTNMLEHQPKKIKLDNENDNFSKTDLNECKGDSCNAQMASNDKEFPRFNTALATTDPDCRECKVTYNDPKPEELVMYLHALKYEGPGWSYRTSVPAWARDDGHEGWVEDGK